MKIARDSFLTSGLRSGRRRRGSWLLEIQIAFALLGIGLAGLCPFVVIQLKQVLNLESRFMATSYTFQRIGVAPSTAQPYPNPQYYTTPSFLASGRLAPQGPPYYYYLVPWNNPWARKLTTRAQLLTTASNGSDTFPVPPAPSKAALNSPPHVTLLQASPSPTSAVGQVSLTLDPDGSGNVTAVTAVVQVNSGTGS